MRCSWGLMAVFAVTVAASPGAQERSRETTDAKYKWNLADLYPSDEAWRAEKEKLAASLGEAKAFAGTLGTSSAQLAKALATQSAQEKALARLFAYANLLADQDTRVSGPQGMTDEMTQLAAQFGAAWAFVEPELLTLDPKTLEDWIASTPELKPYAFALRDVLRRKAHTLSAREEALLAQTLPMAAGPGNINSIFLNADLPWPTVKQASGKEVRLDVAGFSAARAVADRDDRRKAMEALLRRARQLSAHAGHDAEHRRPGGAVPDACPQLRVHAAARARRPEHPAVGLHGARRRREQASAGVSPLPERCASAS